MATRSSLGIFLDNIIGTLSNFVGNVIPYGNYSGIRNYTVSEDNPIVTNPWGVASHFTNPVNTSARQREGLGGQSNVDVYLKPGQSYNFITGKYNDPTLHEKTAARLNQQVNQMKVNEFGLDQASQTTTRGKKSILATVDELYWGDVRTDAYQGTKLGLQDEVKQVGMNTTGKRTILGEGYKKATSTPVAVVVPKSRGR